MICLAPEYKKYDLHAVQVMGANIELWQYKVYSNGILSIDEVFRRNGQVTNSFSDEERAKSPVMVEAGRKAAATRRTAVHTIEQHTGSLSTNLRELFDEVRDYITGLDSMIEESPKMHYIAYKTSQNFVCIQLYRNKLALYLKLNPDEIALKPAQARDVRNIGHFGTGDLEITIKNRNDFEQTKHLIDEALKNIGG